MLKGFKTIFVTCFYLVMIFTGCTIAKKAPKHKPYLNKNIYEVKDGNLTKQEKEALKTRMSNQLDDSSKLTISDILFVIHKNKKPPTFDTAYAAASARNMKASMLHLGYYNPDVLYEADTLGRKVAVTYTAFPGKRTLIDTVVYRLRKADLQALTEKSLDKKILVEGNPITKAAVAGEMARLVDTFRNNGYYKFTSAELGVRGDTSNELLTTITDDPFEQIRLFQLAQARKDSPRIKLQVVLRNPEDSTKLNPYRIRDIYVLEDYFPGDNFFDTTLITQRSTRNFILRYHRHLFRTRFLANNIVFKKGELFRQRDYTTTLNNLTKTGVWESVNIHIREVPDSNLIDLVLELMPEKKFGFEANIEASYSAVSNTNSVLAGNLIGLSLNGSLLNRNIGKEAIKMTHTIRTGIELNNRTSTDPGLINSQELSYRNNVIFPRLVSPFKKLNERKFNNTETFINAGISYNERLDLFSMYNFNLNYGFSWVTKKDIVRDRKWYFTPINAEYTNLLKTIIFDTILRDYPFLKYTYSSALILGMRAGFQSNYRNPRHINSLLRERTIKINAEESGLTWGSLPFFATYKKRYIKTDAEYKYSVNFGKTSYVLRAYTGVGIPVGKNDRSLPFFKQYFGGGSNTMRGWPLRGIGRGEEPLAERKENQFNDRTGDIQLELNGEYRYEIFHIIPNSLILRGALFADAGNIWNMRRRENVIGIDSAQFQFKNLYRQMGMSVGTGLRLDYNNIIIRADFAFRIKRPETSYENNGWKLPALSPNDFFRKIFSSNPESRQWRYENFNFTFGINYPF